MKKQGKGRPKKKVTKRTLERAYRFYKKGKLYKEIIDLMGFSISYWQRNKDIFFEYFESEFQKQVKRESQERGVGRPKGQRKLTLGKRKQLIKCLENDLTLTKSAEVIGVALSTIHSWCKEYPEFKRTMDTARDVGIMSTKRQLANAAKGGFVTEITTKDYIDGKGKKVYSEKTKKKKYIPGNVNAQSFILINRAGWTRDSEHKGENNKGEILKALENVTNVPEEDIKEFD